ncbi:hypothetical protein [Klebsiella pneumoniae]|uniref:hypothetical protein n=1 Tax=Klebsiella pneumoniae TaxID=573 RepID=UPI001F4B8274|nr:hypothetical protein [Klebsiella pneumoniae]
MARCKRGECDVRGDYADAGDALPAFSNRNLPTNLSMVFVVGVGVVDKKKKKK